MSYMKNITIAVLLLFITTTVMATDEGKKKLFDFGVHTGLDIGAAVPYPISRLSDGSYKFTAVPKLSPALGISLTHNINNSFSWSVEATYKTVGIDAQTWVKDQRFTIEYDPLTYQYFTGTADAIMSFSMLEAPLFIRYSTKNQKNTFMLGGYYSWIVKGHFLTTAKKGTLTSEPLEDDYPLTSGEIVTAPVEMPLDDYLGNWDVGWIIGYERPITKEIFFGARFIMGVHDIFKTKCLEYEMWHMRGGIVLSWKPF